MRVYVSLSKQNSIENVIKELERYRDSLISKEELFVKRLADIGVNAAMFTLTQKGAGDAERSAGFDLTFEVNNQTVKGKITISSKPHVNKDGRVFYPHLAWEFGAGTFYNQGIGNPKAKEFGLGPGTFPGQSHVPEPDFWYYRDENGYARRSVGTEATMPMYKASVEMITKIEETAREVFGG